MRISLLEWGIQPLNDKRHKDFSDKAIKTVESCVGSPKKPSPLRAYLDDFKVNSLPEDPIAAIRHVFLNELEDTDSEELFSLTDDLLGESFPPFYEYTNRTGRTFRKRRVEFKKYKEQDLDPFHRFSTRKLAPADYFKEIWSCKDSLAGTGFEALVACQLIHSEACYNCRCRNTMRWNGGRSLGASWADVFCLKCLCTFEVKSKRDVQVIEKGFLRNSFNGGSYQTFTEYEPLGPKRFLLLVSRKPTYDSRTSTYSHPVTIATIDHVTPKLQDAAFASNKMLIGSDIQTKPTSRKLWFSVPACDADFTEMAQQVYDLHFGSGSWTKQLDNRQREAAPPSPEEGNTMDMESLRKELVKKEFEEEDCADNWDDSEDDVS